MPGYLETYFFCEITHAVEFCFEFVGSIIAGCLIMIYSKETEETNLRLDPLTGINVPPLIFVHNWQKIVDHLAGVWTETPD